MACTALQSITIHTLIIFQFIHIITYRCSQKHATEAFRNLKYHIYKTEPNLKSRNQIQNEYYFDEKSKSIPSRNMCSLDKLGGIPSTGTGSELATGSGGACEEGDQCIILVTVAILGKSYEVIKGTKGFVRDLGEKVRSSEDLIEA